jgi:uncharacterized protein (TIGR02001 family)
MMKMRFAVLVAVVLMVGVVQPVSAADVTAAAEINSAYVWRGQTLNDGLVVQPSVDITKGGFRLNVWGNLDIEDYDDQYDSGEFSEVDITASYVYKLNTVDLGLGYIEYLYPKTDRSGQSGTREIYGSLGVPLPFGVSLALDLYWDIDEVSDIYINLGFDYSYAFTKQLSLGAGVSIAYAGDEYCYDDSAGLYDYNFSLSGSFAIDEALSVSAFIKYTDSMDDDNLKDLNRAGSLDVNFYYGIGVSYDF